MNKENLTKILAEKAEMPLTTAGKAVSIILEEITNSLVKGEGALFVGFGNFIVKTRAARKGRNIRTGEDIIIPECKAVKFSAGKALKDAVNRK